MSNQPKSTWKQVLLIVLKDSPSPDGMKLSQIYDNVSKLAPDKVLANQHWQAKVRQTLQMHFKNISKGVWGLNLSEDKLVA